jgi:type II secretory pathway component PulL
MLTLNLLPPEEKESLRLDKVVRAAVFWGRLFLFLICVFAALLATVWLYLSVQIWAMEKLVDVERGGSSSLAARELELKIANVNGKMKLLDDLQSGRVPLVDILKNLATAVPAGVRFDTIAFDAKNRKAILTGRASTREQLIAFQKKIEGSPLFSKVESPVANFIKSENIDFNFSFLIK